MFDKISVRNRLLLVSIVPLLLSTIVMVLLIQSKLDNLIDKEVETAETLLLDTKKAELKTIMQIAYATIKPIYESGGSRDDAVALMRRMEFGEDGYIFGYDANAIRIFSGSSDARVGDSYADFQDVNGVYLIRDLITAGKRNGVGSGNEFVNYHFPRLGQTKAVAKLSYALYLDRWDLMIGTGVYIDQIEKQVSTFSAQSSASEAELLTSIIVAAIIILIALIFASVVVMSSILTPLKAVTDSIQRLSSGNGDLTQRLPVKDNFELGQLSSSLNGLLESLSHLILSVKNVSKSVKSESGKLASEVIRIEEVSARQHKEIEQVATATTQMSQTAQQVSNNAGSAASAAQQADDNGKAALVKVEDSCREMDQLKSEMEKASEVVKQVGHDVENISAVLQVIENIAEQTNLLALNAAIEAARAGEQGRGFAVVADEVRNLASKTQGSTEEIQEMIAKLQNGSRSAVSVMESNISRSDSVEHSIADTSTSLGEIAGSIETMTSVNTQIAAAAEEQSVVGTDISQRIVEISEQTTELSQIAVNSSRNAEKMSEVTQDLEQIVNQFKV